MANEQRAERAAETARRKAAEAAQRKQAELYAHWLANQSGAQPPPDPAASSPAPAPAPVSPQAPRVERPHVVQIAHRAGTSDTGFIAPFSSSKPELPPEPDLGPAPGEPLHESGRGSATGSSAPGWQLWGADKAFKPREPRKHYLARIIVERKLSVFYGQPGSLKSMLVMDALLSLIHI